MKTGPPIAVGETERGGDWGVRVRNPMTSHPKGAAGGVPGVRFREGVSEETDDDESEDESLTATTAIIPETSSLAQRLLWLRQRRLKVLQSSRHHKLNASESPPNHKLNQFNHKLGTSGSPPKLQASQGSPNSSSFFNMTSATSKGASVRVQSPAKSKRSCKVTNLKRFPKTSSSKKSHNNTFVSLSKSNSSNSSSSNSSSSNYRFRRSPTSPSSEENDSLVGTRLGGQPSTSRSTESDPFLPSPPPSPPSSPSRNSPPHSPRWLFGGSRPISTLARPLVALAVPGMFLVCKYHQYKRAHQEACRRRAAERELHHLNHKIVKLLDKLDEHETEMARSREEECVICVNAKATMQTFPCGHRVVCRKCFVKTIQVAVSQRLLPLRCVVCRAKIIRLRQSTTGIPSSVSQYCLGDRRLDRRRDRLAGLPASQSLHSFSSAASAVSGLSLAGCSSDNEGGRARTSRPSLPGRPHDASRSSHSTHGGSSIKTKRIPSSLVPLPRSRPSPPVVLSPPPAGTCLHITPRGLSSPRGLVNPQISISPRGYVDSPRGYADSSRGYVHSSRGYADSPRGYAVGPRGYDDGPRGYADSPRGYADSPRGDVVPRVTSLRRAEHDIRVGTFRRRSYAMSDQLPVGARNIRVHIRENKIAPQDGIARLPTITECSELCSDRQADRRSVIRLRSAQRLLSQLELPPSHCPPSPPSSSPTASFLSLSSPSSSSSLSLSSSSLSSFKSSLASPLPPNSGSSSPRIPSLTPHTPPSSPNSPIEETGYSPRCYFRLRAGGCSHASDDSDTGEDSDGDESDGNGCGGDGHFFSTTSSRAVPGSEELSRTSTKSETLLQSGAESEPIEFSNDGTDDDFFALGLTSIERNFARHGPFKEGNRFFSKAPVFGLCENKKIKFDIYQVTPSSTSVTFDGNQNIKNHIPTPGSPVRSGENVSTDKEAVFSKFTVDNSRPANSMKNNKLAHASPDLGNNHCISDKPVNKLTSVSVKIREKAEIEAETKLSETLRKVETNRVVDGAKSGLKKVPKVNRKGPTNSATSDPKLPSKFSYRDNPKYFFYSYTGDSATEVPLANLASSKSSSSLRCSGKYPSGRSMTKSVSSKSLSSKTKGSSKTRLPKSSSSSSRLAKRTIDDAVMRSSSSNKSISSAASTSSNSSICSITSRCSTNSSVSYKSAVSSQSGSSVTKSKMSRSLASSYNEPQLTKSISFARSASQANQVSSSGPPHHSTSFKIAKSFSSAENESPVLGAASIDKKSSSLKAQTMPKPSSCKKSSAYSYTNSLSKLESFFCKSPPVNYNSLECNSPNSKHDTLSSCKSSREGSLSRELDLSSCSSSSASTATVRSYRSLLPAGLRVSHDTTAIRNRENKDASSCTLVNPNQKIIQKEFKKSSESESSPSLQENEVRSEKSSNKEKNLDKNKSVGKEIIERAFKGGKGKSSRLGRSIKGVRWKEGDKEDNNNTPAKKAKPGTENRKNEGGILRSKVFSGRHYYRFK